MTILRCWFILLTFLCLSAQANPLSPRIPLPADSAFVLHIEQKEQNVILNWDISPGYYLYLDKIDIQGTNVSLLPYESPKSHNYNDPSLGLLPVLEGNVKFDLYLTDIKESATLSITYQGCADFGFCYPPITKVVTLIHINDEVTLPFPLWMAFLLGIGIAFTPCVLPMYPLISRIIVGTQQPRVLKHVFLQALTYTQGMALVYTLLGVAVALIGTQLHVFLQQPDVLILLSILFVLLALSMFGLFNLQLPSSWQTRMTHWSNRQQGRGFVGIFVMGMIAGLISSPCTTAPLSAILLYIAQSDSAIEGGVALYFYALGMGTPLIAVVVFGYHLMPKSGKWLTHIKQLFGFIILSMPIMLLERIYGDLWVMRLWALLTLAVFIWLLVLSFRWSHLWRWLMGIVCLIMIVACVAFLKDSFENSSEIQIGLNFDSINEISQLNAEIDKSSDKMIVLDVYADWCIACKQLEQEVFTDVEVQSLLTNKVLLRADVTNNNDFLKSLNILGLPTIIFFDSSGKELKRISGFITAQEFSQQLRGLSIKE